jgi:hypothetical protein
LRTAPRAPRRVSGGARGARPGHSAGPAAEGAHAVALRLAGALASLSRHRLLDRLIGGRAWIAFVAFALIGIVTMQLGLLKLNSGIGRALEHQALLQRQNAALSIEDSELGAGARVQSRAARIGMELAPLRGLVFLAVRPGVDPAGAAAALATSGPSAAATSEAARATGATASSESGSAPSASSESPSAGSAGTGPAGTGSASTGSASTGSASTGSASESTAAGAPAGASRPSEAASSSPEASARTAPGAGTPSGAEAPAASGSAGAGGGEAPSGAGTGASSSGG